MANTFVFEGHSYAEADVLPVLREAADGFSRADDPDGRLNPRSWGIAFGRAAADALRPALARALAALLEGSAAERDLALQIHQLTGAVATQTLWEAVFAGSVSDLAAGGSDVPNVQTLSYALLASMAQGQADIDPRVWSLLERDDLDPTLRSSFLKLVGALDPSATADRVELFLGHDAADTLRRVQAAVGASGSEGLTRFVAQVAPKLAARGQPLDDAAHAALDAMVEARRKAGR